MRHADNDDEPLPFTKIGLAAALVLNRLRTETQIRSSKADEEKQEEAGADSAGSDTSKEDADNHRRYVDQRLRELAAFEERASGNKGMITDHQGLPRGRKLRG